MKYLQECEGKGGKEEERGKDGERERDWVVENDYIQQWTQTAQPDNGN